MKDEETQNPHEVMDAAIEQVDEVQEAPEAEKLEQPVEQAQTQVPLSALQKERKKRQELELELQWERQRQQRIAETPKPAEEDNSMYESATREDLVKSQHQVVRAVEEKLWIKNNPEKYEKVNEYLPQFLKQRPNLASAINDAPNRYEEAYTLMEALTPKQQQQLKKESSPKKEAPGSPGGIPKAAAMNQTVDVMNMSDAEFSAWRQSQKKRR